MVSANIRLAEPLGEGAMGSVWVADHLTLKTQVAVKFISPDLAQGDPELLSRFEREATAAAQIKSPHVVQTFDHGMMTDGTPFIVMELLEGQSLMELIEAQGALPLALAGEVLVQVARALSKAHEAGIVHRDIKPDNIFVTETEDGVFCKILDFGIAKQTELPKMGGLTNRGTMIGTPEYMSPEQVLSAKDVDHRADLWALAVTLYQCLTAELPFTAEALGELCVKLLDARFAPPSKLRADVPPGVDEWFARALARQPEGRYDNAREAAQAFIATLGSVADRIDHGSLGGSDATLPAPIVRAPAQPTPAEVATLPGTLGGSAANLQTPSQVAKPRSTKMVGLLAGTALLALVGVVALAVLRPTEDGDPTVAEESAAVEERATAGPGEKPTAGGTADLAIAPTATAAPSSAPTAAPAVPSPSASIAARPTASPKATTAPPQSTKPAGPSGPPPPAGSTKVKREDHGF